MLFKTDAREKRNLKTSPIEAIETVIHQDDESDAVQKVALRRLMYKRIEQGNTLTETEENARRRWHSQ